MTPTSIIESPLSMMADLFLDAFKPSSRALALNSLDRTFSQVLDNNMQSTNAQPLPDPGPEPSRESEERRPPLEELEARLEDLGLPLSSLNLNQKDLDRLREVLQESGWDEDKINRVMERLAKGPLTMDRVMAILTALAPEQTQAKAGLALNATTLPFLGRFLQDLGLETDQVKEIISNFKPGQKFGAEILRDILLKHGRTNLKGMTLSGVDLENLQEMLVSLGINDKDLENFWGKFKATKGKMSMEGFLAFLKSVDRPRRLTADQVKNIRQIIQNMTLNNSLRSRLYFDRTVALLQSMGDQEIDSKFISSNPAIQALRGGADSAQAVMRGTGALGQNSPGSADGGQQALAGLANKAGGEIVSSRPAQTGLPSRLSESVLKQVAEKIVYQAKNNQHQLRINLNPPKLGWINIHLVMKGSGLQASIIAENAMVRDALEGQMTQLRDNLAQQGLNLERFDVSLGQDRNQAGTWDRKRRFGGFDEKKAPDLDQADKIPRLTPDGLNGHGLVDILA